MATAVELSVRYKAVGGGLTAVHSIRGSLETELSRISRLTIFVHGFNTTEHLARRVWGRMQELLANAVDKSKLEGIAFFYWPGDVCGLRPVSAPLYFAQVPVAVEAGERLAAHLDKLADNGYDITVQFVGHSLGCRVILSTVQNLAHHRVEVANILLMAAAVPEGLCEDSQNLPRGRNRDGEIPPYYRHAAFEKERVIFSTNDVVLRRAFPVGQWLARRLGDQLAGDSRAAVGYTGGPINRWDGQRRSSSLHHGDYWWDPDCIELIGLLFAPPRDRRGSPRTLPRRWPEERDVPSRMPLSNSVLVPIGKPTASS